MTRRRWLQIDFRMVLLIMPLMLQALAQQALAQPGYDIIIVAGQSNSVGYGCGPFVDVDTANDGRIDQVHPYGWITPAVEPLLHAPNKESKGGKGYAMTFARLYANSGKLASDRRVLLVPTALGSTSILQWDDVDEGIDFDPPRGEHHLPMRFDTTELFDTMIAQSRIGLGAEALGRSTRKPEAPSGSLNRVVALLWQQGETDFMFMHQTTGVPHEKMPNVAAYQTRVVRLMKLIRKTLDQGDFPILMGQIGAYLPIPGEPLVGAFNLGLAQAASELGVAAVASAEGLLPGSSIGCAFNNDPQFPGGDPYHITAAWQVEFGRRFFNSYLSILSGSSAQKVLYTPSHELKR